MAALKFGSTMMPHGSRVWENKNYGIAGGKKKLDVKLSHFDRETDKQTELHCVSKKVSPSTFRNLDIHEPIKTIFGTSVTEKVRNHMMLFPPHLSSASALPCKIGNPEDSAVVHCACNTVHSRLPISPGSAEAQVIWGGIVKCLLNAYFIGSISAKKMSKSVRMCRSYSKRMVGHFWDMVYVHTQ